MAKDVVKRKFSACRPDRRRVQLDCSCDPGRTRIEFQDECDINVLMRKYQQSGILPGDRERFRYGDFHHLPDFMEAMNTVALANEAFAALPATLRKRFGNDPGEFVEFCQDPENAAELVRLGLAEERAAPGAPAGGAPAQVPGAPPAAAPVAAGTTPLAG